MSAYKIFRNGEQINTIEADAGFVSSYCLAGGFTYEIIPESESAPAVPTEQDDTNAMLVDHEFRLTLIELGITEEV